MTENNQFMFPVETNLAKIHYEGKRRRDENFRFRSFLKGQSSDRIDQVVHRLNEEITALIDCRECGNCCKVLQPTLKTEEIIRLARLENLTVKDYEERFVEKDEDERTKSLQDTPCRYLSGKLCTIYNDRPGDCRSYPHVHKKGFNGRTWEMIDNYSICPIVYNVWEGLKIELCFTH